MRRFATWLWRRLVRFTAPSVTHISHAVHVDTDYDMVSAAKRESIRTFLTGWVRGHAAFVSYHVSGIDYHVLRGNGDCSFFVTATLAKRKEDADHHD